MDFLSVKYCNFQIFNLVDVLFLVTECQSENCRCGLFSGNFCGTDKRIQQGYLKELSTNACIRVGLYNCRGPDQVAQIVKGCTGNPACIDNDATIGSDICSNGFRGRLFNRQLNNQ